MLDFFKNKWVQVTAWILLALSSVVLIVAGVVVEDVSSTVVMIGGIVSAVSALIAFIASKIK